MPYVKCPVCGETFRLLVTKDLEEWKKKFPTSQDGNRYIECFDCWKEPREYDVVKVWKVPDRYKTLIDLNDLGTVVMILESYGKKTYEVECVNKDGSKKWLCTLERQYFKCLPQDSKEGEILR